MYDLACRIFYKLEHSCTQAEEHKCEERKTYKKRTTSDLRSPNPTWSVWSVNVWVQVRVPKSHSLTCKSERLGSGRACMKCSIADDSGWASPCQFRK